MQRVTTTVFYSFFAALLLTLSACSNPSHWDKGEKGTAIGGLGGATLGGIVGSQSGNTGTGAVIGGAAGAGAGYLLGNELDKDDRNDRRYDRGRYDRRY